MKKGFAAIALLLCGAGASLAHQGHDHQLLGTVERSRPCHFVMKTQAGETKTIFLSPETKIERGGVPLAARDLAAGTRVSVEVEDDGETAVSVKAGGAK